MRYVLLLITITLFLSARMDGQIILVQGSYPASVIGTDSLKYTTYNSAFPSLAPANGGLWNMDIVTDSTPVFFSYRVLPFAAPAQFADSTNYSLFGYAYKGNIQSAVTSGGIVDYGINIEKVEYTLSSLTGSLTDSLFIDSQNILYTAPLYKIEFPATYNAAWSSSYSSDLDFQLSLSNILFTYNHAPGIVRRYTSEKDTVSGWGKMSVKDATGSPSPYLSVLQVQTTITTIDSFFINGAPFSNALLTVFGLTQGHTVTTYRENYYRMEEVTPLAQVTFTDASFSQPVSAVTHVQRLATDCVQRVIDERNVSVYPNPVRTDMLTIIYPLPAVRGRVNWSTQKDVLLNQHRCKPMGVWRGLCCRRLFLPALTI